MFHIWYQLEILTKVIFHNVMIPHVRQIEGEEGAKINQNMATTRRKSVKLCLTKMYISRKRDEIFEI